MKKINELKEKLDKNKDYIEHAAEKVERGRKIIKGIKSTLEMKEEDTRTWEGKLAAAKKLNEEILAQIEKVGQEEES